MHPAFSVIFLTTLIGVGQGLFLALVTGESYAAVQLLPAQAGSFYSMGSFLALVFLTAGLFASVFHLGRPERAWRSATQWRTSWLSREVIALPAVMGLVFLYGTFHYFEWDLDLLGNGLQGQLTLLLGTLGTLAVFGLFLCTGMIYASVKFLREWASPLTVLNYTLLGGASGFTLAAAFSVKAAPDLINFYTGWAIVITIIAFIVRVASLIRNCRLMSKTTIQTAIGIRHNKVEQLSMGMMGGSFNTREYFSGKTRAFAQSIKWIFLVMVFLIPVILLGIGYGAAETKLPLLAFAIQYTGLLFERWFFFAQANHPQNLYYQTI
jgi:DMSO reductase anchor subunit